MSARRVVQAVSALILVSALIAVGSLLRPYIDSLFASSAASGGMAPETTTAPEPEPEAFPHDPVSAFLPNRVDVYKVDASGQVVESILSMPMDPDPQQMLYVDANGDVRNASGTKGPRADMPGVLKYESVKGVLRSWVGTGIGTVQVGGHAQAGSHLYFQPLVDQFQAVGVGVYDGQEYRFTFTGDQNQSVTYGVDSVCVFNKGDPAPCGDDKYYTNQPDKGILNACEPADVVGQPATQERSVTGHVISSTAAHAA